MGEPTIPDRPPVFELHIRPLFRLLDRDHMLASIDLWDLASVWASRKSILTRVGERKDMPPNSEGGPWPAEWIALFKRWIDTGSDTEPGHHLTRVAPRDGVYRTRPVFGGKIELTADVAVPSEGFRVWFELVSVTATTREYILYAEPPLPAQPPDEGTEEAIDKFKKLGITTLVIHDAVGRHEITL